ncbi:MAG: nucleotidyltransferase family protein [Candidatus Limnocylindrales bacterium]
MSSQHRGGGSAVILAGGRGTRLGALTDAVPKPMLPIDGRPFIEYLVWQLRASGIGRIVISTGYHGEVIRDYFRDGRRWGTEIRYSDEEAPLGTGGAVRRAAALVEDDPFLLLNGDSVCEVDPHALLEAVLGDMLAAMTLTRVSDGGRYGAVELAPDGRVGAFRASGPAGKPALVNAGVYALRREIVDLMPVPDPISLERDVLPGLRGRIRGIVSDGYFIDIGLPETYRQLKRDPRPLLRAVRRPHDFG